MTEHTPAPWKTIKLDGEWYFNPARESGEYALIGKVQKGHSLAKANAAHIVKCVNAHDELVTMLEKCADYYDEQFPNMRFGHPQEIRDLLAKLKEV